MIEGLPMEPLLVLSWKDANRYDQVQHPRPWRAWFEDGPRWEVRDAAGKIVALCDSRGLAETIARLPDLLDGALDIGGGANAAIRERLADL